MEAAAGAMRPLLAKLGELIRNEYGLGKKVKKGLMSLETELEMMHKALDKVASVPLDQLDEQVRIWAGKVRELSYDMEDAIDSFMVRVDGCEPSSLKKNRVKKFLKKTTGLYRKGKDLHQIARAIEEAQELAKQLAELRQRYELDVHDVSAGAAIDPRVMALYKDETELIGIEQPRDELIERLFHREEGSKHRLRTISIVGFGGLGKTTLAKVVYDKIKVQFDCTAFVSVSRSPDVTKIFKKILYELERGRYANINEAERDQVQLIDELRRFLEDKRMKHLSDVDSQRLFYKRIFSHEDGCPHELVQVSRDILKKCGGVPLAIITIASLLSSPMRSKTNDKWDALLNSIGHGLAEEDYEIPRDQLIWIWIAEGFVKCEKHETSLFDFGDSYFNELINRSMIQPIDINVEGKARACRVDDMVLDLILHVSTAKNFVTIFDGIKRKTSSQIKVRRLALQNSVVEPTMPQVTMSMSQVRSVIVFMPAINLMPPLSSFHVLRVLDIEGCELHNLRLRSKNYPLKSGELPVEIGNLQFLQTIDIIGLAVEELPWAFVQLRQLMCLRVGENTRLPGEMGNLASLEVLSTVFLDESPNFVKQLQSLTRLRELSMLAFEMDMALMETLVESLCKLQKIETLDVQALPPLLNLIGNSWVPPPYLRRFFAHGPFLAMPTWIKRDPSLLSNLSVLTIQFMELSQEDLQILGRLPALLSLELDLTDQDKLLIGADGFHCLKVFKIWIFSCDLMFQLGAMPRVENIRFSFSVQQAKDGGNADFDFGLGNLLSLEHIDVVVRCYEVTNGEVEEAEAALRHVAQVHPNHPTLKMGRVASEERGDQSMEVVAGAMGPLLGKLGELLKDEFRLEKKVRKGIRSIETELTMKHAAIHKVDSVPLDQLDEQVRIWAGKVRELSYDMEDVIDVFMVRVEKGPRPDADAGTNLKNRVTKFLKKTTSLFRKGKDLHQIASAIEEAQELVKQLAELRQRYELEMCGGNVVGGAIDPHVIALYKDVTELIFKKMLYELDKGKYANINEVGRDEVQLIDELRRFLEGKRYLIIIDDIWDEKFWGFIKYAFTSNQLGSRLITTTRKISVSQACCSSSDDMSYKMKHLSDADSKRLFYKRIFLHENKCPHELEQVSRNILKKCGGVPLAIITIASLLSSTKRIKTSDQWHALLNSIGHGLAEGDSVEKMQRIMSFKDYEIPRDQLIWRWIAEGFVQREKHETSHFELGESYFNELINRSSIEPIDIDMEGRAVYMIWCLISYFNCQVEITLLLYTMIFNKKTSLQSKVRRLALQSSVASMPQVTMNLSQVRSVTVFRPAINLLPPLSSFHVLRVLDIDGFELQYLRLFAKNYPEKGGKLPVEIGNLRFLQTIDITGIDTEELPWTIIQLRQLMCLHVHHNTRLPDEIGNLTSLEALSTVCLYRSPNFVKQLQSLTGLRELSILSYGMDETLMENLVESLCKLQKLKTLEVRALSPLLNLRPTLRKYRSSTLNLIGNSWVPSPLLHRFFAFGVFDDMPAWIKRDPSLLSNLSVLDISFLRLPQEDLQFLGRLPSLLSLKLSVSVQGKLLIGADDGFHSLKVFELWIFQCGPVFQQGAMPRVEDIRVWNTGHRDNAEFDFGLGNLLSLEHIDVTVNCSRATKIASGALRPLLAKLGEVIKDEYGLEKKVKRDIKSLETELEMMYTVLHKVASVPWNQLDELDRLWSGKVRELSYDMEDAIDAFMVRVDKGHEPADAGSDLKNRVTKFLRKTTGLFRKGKDLHRIADAIEEAHELSKHLGELRRRYELEIHGVNTPAAIDPRVRALYKDVSELIGVEQPRDELIDKLLDGEEGSRQRLRTISIVGFGGLGKTTLAKAVYDKIKVQFDCTAIVSVMKKINEAVRDERQLVDELRQFLEDKRYLIIIDDIWDEKVWEFIKIAFPINHLGSRLITTTRKVSVCEACCSSTDDIVYRMKHLSDVDSQRLFCKRIFSHKDGCPHELQQVSRDILKKCGGVPLAIINIASLLSSKQIKTNDQWHALLNSIGRGLVEGESVEEMQSILSLSYDDLPSHMKTCLLYLSIFPEDYEIQKDRLIWRWIAEGFVKCFEFGESCFNELINRSMIQPINIDVEGNAEACRVHDMVLDLILHLSSRENFVTIFDDVQEKTYLQRKVRRLALQNSKVEATIPHVAMSMSQVRSITVFSPAINPMPPLGSFHVLRVLDIEDCEIHNLSSVGSLFHLRLRAKNIFEKGAELPLEIGNLRFLQTLDTSGVKMEELPKTIVQLRRLTCLYVDQFTRLPDGIGNLTSLEALSRVSLYESPTSAKQLQSLTSLRELSLLTFGMDEALVETVVESLCKLHKIETLHVLAFGPLLNSIGRGWAPSPHLRKFTTFGGQFDAMPAWIKRDPLLMSNLSVLRISFMELPQNDLQILGRLPALLSLNLGVMEQDKLLIGVDDGFKCLKVFELIMSSSCGPMFQLGAMPRVENIQFRLAVRETKDDGNTDFDFGLGNLLSLEHIDVEIHCGDATKGEVEEVEAALRHAAHVHPNHPTLKMERYGQYQMRDHEGLTVQF
uniref:Uncharacterized protein n=1 Tax=Oryza nivara TaxID=4536 RepID=A0A0E0J3V8_ORYNI